MEHRSKAETVRAEAAAWVVRLHAPSCTDADRAEFAAWRDASFHNEAAYERELAAWERLDRLSVLGAGDGPIDADLLAKPPTAGRRPPMLRAAAVVTLTAGALATAALVIGAPPAYATGVGERRVVVLKDGSRIELNTDTKVVVRMNGRTREVTLVRGEALFQVAEDARPFVVVAEHARLTTRKSELAVRLDEEQATVSVSHGDASLASDAGPPLALPAHSEATAAKTGAQMHIVSAEDISRSQAWRQGGIWLDGRSLAEAADEFNRYNVRKLEVADESIADLRLGGYFRTSDVQGFVAALTKAFPIKVEARKDVYRLEPRG